MQVYNIQIGYRGKAISRRKGPNAESKSKRGSITKVRGEKRKKNGTKREENFACPKKYGIEWLILNVQSLFAKQVKVTVV